MHVVEQFERTFTFYITLIVIATCIWVFLTYIKISVIYSKIDNGDFATELLW